MKVTITLDEETVHRARAEATRRDMNLSEFVGELLAERKRADDEYERAMAGALSAKPVKLKEPGERASAATGGCERLPAEDLTDGQANGGVTVVNPFVHPPS
jgi:hypothetical protein